MWRTVFRDDAYTARWRTYLADMMPNPFASLGDVGLLPRLSASARVSLKHFLPELPYDDRRRIADDLVKTHVHALFDFQELEGLSDPAELDELCAGPETTIPARSIVAAFHLGSFRLIPAIVARLGEAQDLVILLSTEALAVGGTMYRNMFAALRDVFEVRPHLVDVEKPGGLRRAASLFRNGATIVVYFDGFSGAGGMTRKDEKLMDTKFLDGVVAARQGVPFLSRLLKAPIYCAYSTRDCRGLPSVCVERSTTPDGTVSRDAYVNGTLSVLYSFLGRMLRAAPETWEGWWYVYKAAKPPIRTGNATATAEAGAPASFVRLDLESFDILPLGNERYLTDIQYLRFRGLPAGPEIDSLLGGASLPFRSDSVLLTTLLKAGALISVEAP